VQTEEQAEEEQAETEQAETEQEVPAEVQTAEQAEEEQKKAKDRGSAGTPPVAPPERRSRMSVGAPERRRRPPQETPAEVGSLTG
jgi:hypothetical protein